MGRHVLYRSAVCKAGSMPAILSFWTRLFQTVGDIIITTATGKLEIFKSIFPMTKLALTNEWYVYALCDPLRPSL